MRGIGADFMSRDPLDALLDDLMAPSLPTKAKRVVKTPNGPALVRLECADGLLIEGQALEYRIEPPQGDRPGRVTLTFLAETTTPDWKAHHTAGEDMGEPINPDDPELQPEPDPTPPANPKWGQFA